jgi:hypothetical protein
VRPFGQLSRNLLRLPAVQPVRVAGLGRWRQASPLARGPAQASNIAARRRPLPRRPEAQQGPGPHAADASASAGCNGMPVAHNRTIELLRGSASRAMSAWGLLFCVAALRLDSFRLPESLRLPESFRLPGALNNVARSLPRRSTTPPPPPPPVLPQPPPGPNPLLSSLHDAFESVTYDPRLSGLHDVLEHMSGDPLPPTPSPPPSSPRPPQRLLPSLAGAAAAVAALWLLISAWLVPWLLRPDLDCSYAFLRLSPSRGLSIGLAAVRIAPAATLATANSSGLGMFFPTRLTDAHFDELGLDISLVALAGLLWRRCQRQEGTATFPAPSPATRPPPIITVRLRGARLLHSACAAPEWHGGTAALEAYLVSAKEGTAGRAVAVLEPHTAAAAANAPTNTANHKAKNTSSHSPSSHSPSHSPSHAAPHASSKAASVSSCAVPPAPLGRARLAIRLAMPYVRVVAAPCEMRYADAPSDACLTLGWRRLAIDFSDPVAATHAGVVPQRMRVRMGGFRIHAERLPLEAPGTLRAAEQALRTPPRLPPLVCAGSHQEDAVGGRAGGLQGWLHWVRDVWASLLGKLIDNSAPSGMEVHVATEYRPDLVSSRTVRIGLYGPAPLRVRFCPESQAALDRLLDVYSLHGGYQSLAADAINAGKSKHLTTAKELDALIARAAAADAPPPPQAVAAAKPPPAPAPASASDANQPGTPAPTPVHAPSSNNTAAADAAAAYPTHVLTYAKLLGTRRARRQAGFAPPPAAGLSSLCARLQNPSVSSGGSGVPVPTNALAPPLDEAWVGVIEALEAGERWAGEDGGIPAAVIDARARQILAVTDHLQYDPPPLDLAPYLSRMGYAAEPARMQLGMQLPHVVVSLSTPSLQHARDLLAHSSNPHAASATPPLRELARLTLGPEGGGVDMWLSQRRRGKTVSLTLGNFHIDDPAADGSRSTPFRELLAPCSHPGGGGPRKPSADAPMLRLEMTSSTLGEPPPSCLPAAPAAAGWPAGPPPTHTAVKLEICNAAFVLLSELLTELGGWREACASQAKPRPPPPAEARASYPLALGEAGPLWLPPADAQAHRAGKRVPPSVSSGESAVPPSASAEAAAPAPPRETTDRSTWRGLRPWAWEDELAARAARAAALARTGAPTGIAADELRDAMLLHGAHMAVSVSVRNVLLILPCAAEGVAVLNEDADKGWAFCIAVSNHRCAPALCARSRGSAPFCRGRKQRPARLNLGELSAGPLDSLFGRRHASTGEAGGLLFDYS